MCEWLSCREWCDVRLLCGGRTFNAHRAVLASVSTFLRQILLSCPIEDSPTFIVLPDFDLEAMSSVLYYIYNGEVIVQKQKLEMFMDIIKAMQIFIENQYLPKICRGEEDIEWFTNMPWNNKVFPLEARSSIDPLYVNLKKGEQNQDIIQQCSVDNSNFKDKQVSCQDRSEQETCLGNLPSLYGDRQRNSFLRDLYKETYPRNGYSNGRTSGVLAIPNERYHEPTSVLLTNANGKHPRVDDIHLEWSKKTMEDMPHLFTGVQLHKQTHRNVYDENIPNIYENLFCMPNTDASQDNLELLFDNYSMQTKSESIKKNHLQQTTGLRKLTEKRKQSLDLSTAEMIKDSTHTPQVQKDLNQQQMVVQNIVMKNFSTVCYKDDDCNLPANVNTKHNLTKSAILNQVMQSPWCPRFPNNYRPFRRKVRNPTTTPLKNESAKEKGAETTNDSNNNVQTLSLPSSLDEKPESVPQNDTKEPLKTSYTIDCLIGSSDLKCTSCDQVFTSNESLTAHMRRHAPSTRYTCGECSKSFSQLRNFKYHMSIHRGTREFAATCTVCGKYFNDRGYLSSHMKIHRNRKEYRCSQCPKSFNQRVAYNMHVRIHTGVKPHACDECGKAFSRKMLLKQHQRTHSGERPYACPHCDKRFADRSNMTLHLRLHTGIKPFSCSLCPKSFTKKHHLKSHLNFHTGAKPYSCPRCKLAFTQSSNMRTHFKKCNVPAPPAS